MNELPFNDVGRIAWLLLVGVCVVAAIWGYARKAAAMRAFADARLWGVLAPDVSRARQIFKTALVLAAMVCIVVAAMGPRWGTFYEEVFQPQLDIVVCLDVSKSMLAEDAGMSRLDRAKDDIKRLLSRLTGGTIGLVAFAGKATLVCPMTDDYEFYRLALHEVGVHSAPLGGTNLADAIRTAGNAFDRAGRLRRVVVLMTDGEDLGGSAVQAATEVHEAGVDIYAIGIGDADRGGLIPVNQGGQRTYVMHDGQQVWSKLDESILRQVVQAGGGAYERSRLVTNSERTLEWLYAHRIAPALSVEAQQRKAPRQWPRHHWFGGLALALLAMETLVSERRSSASPREEASGIVGAAPNQRGLGVWSQRGTSEVQRPVARPVSSAIAGALAFACLFASSSAVHADSTGPAEAARRVAEGNRLMDERKFDDALSAYDAAAKASPEAPEVAYNRGLALYRLGRLPDAEKAFQDAIRPGRPEIEARAKYNLGRVAQDLAATHGEGDEAAINDLNRAIRFYDDALQLAPTDVDAKRNKELAARMRQYIERRVKPEQQKEKKPSSQPSSQPSSRPENGDQQGNPQSQSSSQPSSQPSQQDQSTSQPDDQNASSQPSQDDKNKDKKDPKDSDKDNRKGDQKNQQDQKKNDDQKKDGDQDQDQDDAKQGDKEKQESRPRSATSRPAPRHMTPEEAERYLQQARDAEAKRRELRRQMLMRQQGRVPVDKDW